MDHEAIFLVNTLYFVMYSILVELGRRILRVSGEVNSTAFLLQRLSIAVQRGNAASVLGTIGSTEVM